jgi:RNA polymerase sigma-70 factor (ECF subfamily)
LAIDHWSLVIGNWSLVIAFRGDPINDIGVPSEPELSDATLVAALNKGDWTAFDTLYHRHKEWAYRLAWRFCRNTEDAHDAVQETFIYLAKKFPGFELSASFTTFLYPAVKHTALAIRRKRQRSVEAADDFEAMLSAPPETPPVEAQRRELGEALGALPETHREVLLMRHVDDMTLEEIAAALQIPLGTAKSRLHHATRSLRDDPAARRFFGPE